MSATTQQCRDCGETFPYDEDADRCDKCCAEMLDTQDYAGAVDEASGAVYSDADAGL